MGILRRAWFLHRCDEQLGRILLGGGRTIGFPSAISGPRRQKRDRLWQGVGAQGLSRKV